MRDLIPLGAVALIFLDVLFVVLLLGRRVLLRREETRRLQTEERLRELALALTDGEEPPELRLSPEDARILAALLGRYARWLTGAAREHIASYFERRDAVAHEARVLARDRRTWRRARAAHTLGRMCSWHGVAPLVAGLDDRHRDVRSAAARSLGELGAVGAVSPLVRALARGSVPHAAAAGALVRLGGAAASELERLAGEADTAVASVAVELLGLVGDASHAAALIERLDDPDPALRAVAARGLGRLGAEDAEAALVRSLRDPAPAVRVAAARALASVGGRHTAGALSVASRDEDFEVARAASQALAELLPAHVRSHHAAAPRDGHLREAGDLLRLETGT